MSDNLISFSKDAAKTLGISEAILLHALTNALKPSKEDFISFEDVLERLNFWEEKKLQNFRDLLSRMRSFEHFRGDKLSRLDVKSVNILPF